MIRRLVLLPCVLVLGAPPVHAQLLLPGAAHAPQGGPAAASPGPKKGGGPPTKIAPAIVKGAKTVPAATPDVAGIVGQPLLLNGRAGLLQISGDKTTVRIEKLRFAGEGVSDPSQRCVVDIVGEKPIEARSVGRPDGLERFEADVPACPFAFDVLDGAALVPPQITACVFKAADCQTNPSGLWGPDGSTLEKNAETIAAERAEAEKAMGKIVHAIQSRADNSDEAANLLRDQSAFPGQRDDACRDYAKESVHGFCASRLTEARTALLQARLAALGPGAQGKPEKRKKKSAKEAKPQ